MGEILVVFLFEWSVIINEPESLLSKMNKYIFIWHFTHDGCLILSIGKFGALNENIIFFKEDKQNLALTTSLSSSSTTVSFGLQVKQSSGIL